MLWIIPWKLSPLGSKSFVCMDLDQITYDSHSNQLSSIASLCLFAWLPHRGWCEISYSLYYNLSSFFVSYIFCLVVVWFPIFYIDTSWIIFHVLSWVLVRDWKIEVNVVDVCPKVMRQVLIDFGCLCSTF